MGISSRTAIMVSAGDVTGTEAEAIMDGEAMPSVVVGKN